MVICYSLCQRLWLLFPLHAGGKKAGFCPSLDVVMTQKFLDSNAPMIFVDVVSLRRGGGCDDDFLRLKVLSPHLQHGMADRIPEFVDMRRVPVVSLQLEPTN